MPIDPLRAPVHLLEVGHVAHRLSASPGFVRRLIREHKLPAIRLGGRFRIDAADLDAFLDALRKERDADTADRARGRTARRPDRQDLREVRSEVG
jgi:excisionase family DNA binding protein